MSTELEASSRRIAALSPQRRALLAARLAAEEQALLRFESLGERDGGPLSSGQQRMWELLTEHPQLPVNVVCQVIELRGALEVERLRAAVEAFVARHRVLGSRVAGAGAEARQQQGRAEPPVLWRVQALAADEGDVPAALDAMARAQAYETGNGDSGPWLIFSLVPIAAEHHALLFTAQNLVFDAMSFSLMLEEVGQRYCGKPLASAPLHHMLDAADWQRRWLQSTEYRRRLAHWTEQLAGLDVTPLAPELTRPPQRGFRGERVEFEISRRTRERMAELCRQNRATPFMGMAAVALQLCRHESGSTDAVMGTLTSGRFRPELERIVGLLLNIVPLHARPGQHSSFVELLAEVRSHVLAAQTHDGVPYEELARALGRPIFDLLFIYENIPAPEGGFGELAVTTRDVDKGCARFDLSLAIYDEPARMHGWLEYDLDLFTRPTIERMIERFVGLLEAAVSP